MRRVLLIGAIIVLSSGCSETPLSPTRADRDAVGAGTAATDARIDTSVGHGGVLLRATLTGAIESWDRAIQTAAARRVSR